MVKIHGLAPRAAWLKSMIWHPVPHGKNMAWHPVPHVTTGLDASPTIDRRLLIGSRQWPEQQLKTPIVKPVSYPFAPNEDHNRTWHGTSSGLHRLNELARQLAHRLANTLPDVSRWHTPH